MSDAELEAWAWAFAPDMPQAVAVLRVLAERNAAREMAVKLGDRCLGLVELVSRKADRRAA